MPDNAASQNRAECWQLDLEIEQTQRLLKVWQAHALFHGGNALGEAIESIASGYERQLDNLKLARKQLDES